MSVHCGDKNSHLQDIETRLHSKLDEIVESKLESKLEGLVESVASLLEAKLVGLGSAHGEAGGVSAGVSTGGVAAEGADQEAASTGEGGRDAASLSTPTACGGRAAGAMPSMGLEGSREARGFHPQGEVAAGGPGRGLGGGLRGGLGGLGGPGLAGPAGGRDHVSLHIEITPPQFKGGTDEYPEFREEFLQAAKMADIDDQFVGRRVRPVPVGNAGKSRSKLLAEGFSAEEVTAGFYAWQFLSSALQQACDRDLLHRSISPKDAFASLDACYNLHTWGAVQDQFGQFARFSIAPKDDPVDKLSELEVLGNRLRLRGVTIDSRLLLAHFLSALPPEYEHAKLTLLSAENLLRSDVIRVVGAHHWYFSRQNGNQPQVSHALTAAGDSPQQSGRDGRKRGGRNRRKGGSGGSKQRGSAHSAGSGSTSGERTGSDRRRCHRCGRVGHIRSDCTTLESDLPVVCMTCNGFGHTSDVCTSEVEEVTLAIMLD